MTRQHQVHDKNLDRRGPDWRRVRDGHTCHWTGCGENVPPRLWGCKKHWFRLPPYLRNKIWANYVPGQETRKDPTPEYLAVADEVQAWIREKLTGEKK